MAEYLCKEDMSTGEYISRDVALRQLNATCLATDCNNYNGVRCRACAYADVMDFIDAIPAADVQPVKHGKWENKKYDALLHCYSATCSEYGYESTDHYSITDIHRYCEYCGARMIKEDCYDNGKS